MSQTIELPDALYDALKEAAAARGMTPDDWITERIARESRATPSRSDGKPAKTMADLFAGRVGVISSGSEENLSENTAERFTDYLEEKRRMGTL